MGWGGSVLVMKRGLNEGYEADRVCECTWRVAPIDTPGGPPASDPYLGGGGILMKYGGAVGI